MMKTALLAMLAMTLPQQQTAPPPGTLEYRNDELELSFFYPADWKKTETKKKTGRFAVFDPKTWRGPDIQNISTNFVIPLEGKQTASVRIYALAFNAETDIWQASQLDVNQQMGQQVVKQWQEDLLGVPLMLTEIQSTEKNVPTLTECGMLYSMTARKLVFRVTAPATDFERVDGEWRTVLQSLRTYDGRLPNVEVAGRPLGASEAGSGTFRKDVWAVPTVTAVPKPEKAPVALPVTYGKQKLVLHIPSGWKAQSTSDQTVTLVNGDLSSPAVIKVFNVLDGDPPDRALVKLSAKDLDSFSQVKRRNEVLPFTNHGGATVAYVERTGDGTGKPFMSFEAVGASGDYYWSIAFTSADAGAFGRTMKALEGLCNAMSVEPAP